MGPSHFPFTIGVVDDEPLFRQLMRDIIAAVEIGLWAFEAASLQEAIAAASHMVPELLLVDLNLPDGSGWVLVDWIKRHAPRTRVVIVSGIQNEFSYIRATQAPVVAWIDKMGTTCQQWRDALRAVGAGRAFYSESVRGGTTELKSRSDSWYHRLSSREQELVAYFGLGRSDEEIGMELLLSSHTVHTHRKNVMRKLDLHSTTQLIRWAWTRGFVVTRAMGSRHVAS